MSQALQNVRQKLEAIASEKESIRAERLAKYESLVIDIAAGKDADAAAVLATIEAAGMTYQRFETDVKEREQENAWTATAATKDEWEQKLAAHVPLEEEFMERRKRIEDELRVEGGRIADVRDAIKAKIAEATDAGRRLNAFRASRSPDAVAMRTARSPEEFRSMIGR